MKAKRGLRWLKSVLAVLAALLMALLCHVAVSPYNILPSSFKYAVYPVSGTSLVQPLIPGDLAVCLKGAELGAGWSVKYVQHPLSSFAAAGGPMFGYMLEYAGVQGAVYDVYKVQVEIDGEMLTLNSSRPELLIYRVQWLGGAVLWLHQYRAAVLCICGGTVFIFIVAMLATARPRRLKRQRELYLKMFEEFARRFESEAE